MTVAATPAPVPASRLIFALSGIGFIGALLALPVVLLAGAPLNGWVLGTAVWSANWAAQLFTGKLLMTLNPTAAVGMSGISFIARAWLIAAFLFVIALRYDETIGLVAAGVFLVAFSFDLIGRTLLYSLRQRSSEEENR